MDNKLIGTFIICPDCSGSGRDTLNIELSGSLIYEIINADEEWVRSDNCCRLQSGTKVTLPPGTEVTANSKIDLKGGAPQIYMG